MTTGFIAESFSLVMMMGGLGLFFDPGGRPRGFLAVSDDGGERRRFLGLTAAAEEEEMGRGGGLSSSEEESEVGG